MKLIPRRPHQIERQAGAWCCEIQNAQMLEELRAMLPDLYFVEAIAETSTGAYTSLYIRRWHYVKNGASYLMWFQVWGHPEFPTTEEAISKRRHDKITREIEERKRR